VVADIAKLSVGREAYYTRELATDHEQYLSGHGESPGRWYGAGATTLGLQGEASVAGFQAMFEGRDPTTGELLGRPHGRNAVPAFDVVLRPTKSVSILYGLGDPTTGRAVLEAHHAGVAEATAYLDEHLGTRRGHGGHEHVDGQGLLAVGFDHRTIGGLRGDGLPVRFNSTRWTDRFLAQWPPGSPGYRSYFARITGGTHLQLQQAARGGVQLTSHSEHP
jgi:TrwC relaxase